MPITIKKIDGGYVAEVTHPHGGAAWTTPAPLTADALVSELQARGCHQTDIGDAFYEADPDWLNGR